MKLLRKANSIKQQSDSRRGAKIGEAIFQNASKRRTREGDAEDWIKLDHLSILEKTKAVLGGNEGGGVFLAPLLHVSPAPASSLSLWGVIRISLIVLGQEIVINKPSQVMQSANLHHLPTIPLQGRYYRRN